MGWIHYYQLFLFDFDGILVNTEELHYKSYLKMCSERGFSLDWSQHTYMRYALFSASAIQKAIYQYLPQLYKEEPSWDILYGEKKRIYKQLLESEGTSLMPGVEALLHNLERHAIKRCVVTHSAREQIEVICQQHPILKTIPTWVTREDYTLPKPSSECYSKAISLLKAPEDRIIGFEDSPRGLTALLGTEATGVLVSNVLESSEIQTLQKQIKAEQGKSFCHALSFENVEESLILR